MYKKIEPSPFFKKIEPSPFFGDFHIHSHYSIATSKKLIPEYIDYWAGVKGIKVVGTGDFTHPGWLEELQEKLEPAQQGLFKLKKEYKNKVHQRQPFINIDGDARFVLTSEISNIYKKNGKVRKVHNLIFVPDFSYARRIQKELKKIGNINSDGRPILGMDSKNLLEIVLESGDDAFFVPSHIWTPWFSVLGAKSGFDSIQECFEDLSENISAVETGLSSDPPMNWMCSFLDKYTLISNSDAHSPQKLGREANIFNTELSYDSIINAIKQKDSGGFLGTLEFFPQEGKYHYDGHRKCGINWDPLETLKNKGICPNCGKKVTVGVMNRVMQLSDRESIKEIGKKNKFTSLVPLKEILSEILEVGPKTKTVSTSYNSIVNKAGSEFNVLLNVPIEELQNISNSALAEAVRRMRHREVYIKEGFDGEYGQIKVFDKNESKDLSPQNSLFKDFVTTKKSANPKAGLINFNIKEYRELARIKRNEPTEEKDDLFSISEKKNFLQDLNPAQLKAVKHFKGPAVITAGPGTGKTRVLTCRIANLIKNKEVKSDKILAVTFTNKAADEMKSRLSELLNEKKEKIKINVCTFHALGYDILRNNSQKIERNKGFVVIDEQDKKRILKKELGYDSKEIEKYSEMIHKIKNSLEFPDKPFEQKIFNEYEEKIKELNLVDLDDLIYKVVNLFKRFSEVLSNYRQKFRWIMVDEYQDFNACQYEMINMLMPEENSNLYVIGDPNQAIYGFRGADLKFINYFSSDYPDALTFRLEKSYRCSNSILKASDDVIGREKKFLQGIKKGLKVKIVENSTDKSEAEFIARKIEEMMGGLRFFSMDSKISQGEKVSEINSLSDFAVLCRLKSQMKKIEKAFKDHNIPYQKAGESSLSDNSNQKTVIDIIKGIYWNDNIFLKNKIDQRGILNNSDLSELKDLKQETVQSSLNKIIDKYIDKKENKSLERLVDCSKQFGNDYLDFIKFATLGTDVDTYSQHTEKVSLMTIHSAKGLEFNCIFVPGCEDGIIPYSIFKHKKAQPEEEKRLLYVAMTRAKKFLFITHAKRRFLMGRQLRLQRSPFLKNIEKELIELTKSTRQKKQRQKDRQLDLF
ncbi:MAG: UvrD-helicase domain-containing protein [Elusimicrobiota bacterium]